MEKGLISIIIPVFNSESTILETLQSVSIQTYSNLEMICVDDCSTDNSVNVITEYAEHDQRVRIIIRDKKTNGGSVCRNIGASVSNGEYLIFLDSDDLLAPNCLETRYLDISKTECDFIVYPMAYFRNNVNDYSTYSNLKAKNDLFCFASGVPIWQVTSPIIRKSFFDKISGFDESYQRYQDVEFHLRAIIESKGNYIKRVNAREDCFYRLPVKRNYYNNVKLERSIDSCPKLISLFCSYSNYINNRLCYSLAIISIYTNMMLFYFALFKQSDIKSDLSCITFDAHSHTDCWVDRCVCFIMTRRPGCINYFVLKSLRRIIYFIFSKGVL